MPDNALSDEMLEAYFQALARRAPTLPDVPVADEPPPPTPVPERLPSADELIGRPDLRNPPTTPPEFLGPPPARNETERMIEGSMGLDYSEPGRGPAGPPPNRAGALPPRSVLGPYEEDIIPSSSSFLGPQSDLERQELERHNRQVEGGVNALMLAGSVTAPGAIARGARIAGEGASVLGRAYGGTLARAPRTVAATTAGVTTAAGAGQAEPPGELDTVNSTLRRLRTRQTELETEDTNLRARAERINNLLKTANPRTFNEDVQKLQRELRMGQDDGRLGGNTRAAIERELQRIETERARVGRDRDTGSRDIERQEGRARALERQGNRDAAEVNLSEFDRTLRRYSGPIGFVAGLAGGPAVNLPARYGATRGINALTESRVAAANALLGRAPNDISGRIGGLNEFVRRGGGRDPLELAPRARGGFKETRPTPRFGELYPPRAPFGRPELAPLVHPADVGVVGSMAGVAGYQEINLYLARQELAAARAENDGSRQAQERLARAETAVDWANLRANVTRGAPLTYPLTAIPFRYRNPRPNVELGERELHRLSSWRRRQ